MPIQDRTNEFKACVESIRSRSAAPTRMSEQRQRLLSGGKEANKSEFTRMAVAIGKDISSTAIKLGKLGQRTFSLVFVNRICLVIVLSSGQAEDAV